MRTSDPVTVWILVVTVTSVDFFDVSLRHGRVLVSVTWDVFNVGF